MTVIATARELELEAALKWVGEVYPGEMPDGGARVEMTWDQFNEMRRVIGLKPLPKPYVRRPSRG